MPGMNNLNYFLINAMSVNHDFFLTSHKCDFYGFLTSFVKEGKCLDLVESNFQELFIMSMLEGTTNKRYSWMNRIIGFT